ncbi:hypothetical protein DIC82_05655 [Clostridium beijerinckii]|nr:hypothetical protein DIC82_05655 [Clostridium beijerinckii]
MLPLRVDSLTLTDFLINRKVDNKYIEVARAIKTQTDIENPRTIEKLLIEKKYWEIMGIDWGIVTEDYIPKIKAINIYSIYNDYFWKEEGNYSDKRINELIYQFKYILTETNYDVLLSSEKFQLINNLNNGEGLRFLRYLLAIKELKTDMNIKFNFSKMKVWF